jgi:hypothetical protein
MFAAGHDGINRVYGVQQTQLPSPLGTIILWRDEPTIFAVTPNRTIPTPLPLSDLEDSQKVERWIKDVTLDAYLERK